jgi:exodeoxyribonuclease-3
MRIVSWNVMGGGGGRCGGIVQALIARGPDLIVLQETIPSRGPELCHALRAAGYRYTAAAPRQARARGLCVLARERFHLVVEQPAAPPAGIYPRGWLEVELPERGLRVAGVYAPAEGPALPAFWDATAAWVRCRLARPFVLIGDFNAGASRVDAEDYRFKAGRGFAALATAGLIDLWRQQHGERREHTWFSRRGGALGRGFRIDHAFASPAFAPRVRACWYDHTVRERGWSDHSLLAVDLDGGAAAPAAGPQPPAG